MGEAAGCPAQFYVVMALIQSVRMVVVGSVLVDQSANVTLAKTAKRGSTSTLANVAETRSKLALPAIMRDTTTCAIH